MIFSHKWISKIWTTSKSSSNWRRIVPNTNGLEVLNLLVLMQAGSKMNRSPRDTNCIKNIEVRKRYQKNNHISRIQNVLVNRKRELISFCRKIFRKIIPPRRIKVLNPSTKKRDLYLHLITASMLANFFRKNNLLKTKCINLFLTRMGRKEYLQSKGILVKLSQQISIVKMVNSFSFCRNISVTWIIVKIWRVDKMRSRLSKNIGIMDIKVRERGLYLDRGHRESTQQNMRKNWRMRKRSLINWIGTVILSDSITANIPWKATFLSKLMKMQ